MEKEISEILPSMNVNLPATKPEDKEECIVSDEALLTIYSEIIGNLRDDRKEINGYIESFAEPIINGGDATTSSKEALVNLIKIKSETADKMSKVADLMTRIKLKDNNTMPRWLSAKQENNVYLKGPGVKRSVIRALEKAQKKIQEDK